MTPTSEFHLNKRVAMASVLEDVLREVPLDELSDAQKKELEQTISRLGRHKREAKSELQSIEKIAWTQTGEAQSLASLCSNIDELLSLNLEQFDAALRQSGGMLHALLKGASLYIRSHMEPAHADFSERSRFRDSLRRLKERMQAEDPLASLLTVLDRLIPEDLDGVEAWIDAFNTELERGGQSAEHFQILAHVYTELWRFYWKPSQRDRGRFQKLRLLAEPAELVPAAQSDAFDAGLAFDLLWHRVMVRQRKIGWAGSREFLEKHQILLRSARCPLCGQADCPDFSALVDPREKGLLTLGQQPVDAVFFPSRDLQQLPDCYRACAQAAGAQRLSEFTSNSKAGILDLETELGPNFETYCASSKRVEVIVLSSLPALAGGASGVRFESTLKEGYYLQATDPQGCRRFFLEVISDEDGKVQVRGISEIEPRDNESYASNAGAKRMNFMSLLLNVEEEDTNRSRLPF